MGYTRPMAASDKHRTSKIRSATWQLIVGLCVGFLFMVTWIILYAIDASRFVSYWFRPVPILVAGVIPLLLALITVRKCYGYTRVNSTSKLVLCIVLIAYMVLCAGEALLSKATYDGADWNTYGIIGSALVALFFIIFGVASITSRFRATIGNEVAPTSRIIKRAWKWWRWWTGLGLGFLALAGGLTASILLCVSTCMDNGGASTVGKIMAFLYYTFLAVEVFVICMTWQVWALSAAIGVILVEAGQILHVTLLECTTAISPEKKLWFVVLLQWAGYICMGVTVAKTLIIWAGDTETTPRVADPVGNKDE